MKSTSKKRAAAGTKKAVGGEDRKANSSIIGVVDAKEEEETAEAFNNSTIRTTIQGLRELASSGSYSSTSLAFSEKLDLLEARWRNKLELYQERGQKTDVENDKNYPKATRSAGGRGQKGGSSSSSSSCRVPEVFDLPLLLQRHNYYRVNSGSRLGDGINEHAALGHAAVDVLGDPEPKRIRAAVNEDAVESSTSSEDELSLDDLADALDENEVVVPTHSPVEEDPHKSIVEIKNTKKQQEDVVLDDVFEGIEADEDDVMSEHEEELLEADVADEEQARVPAPFSPGVACLCGEGKVEKIAQRGARGFRVDLEHAFLRIRGREILLPNGITVNLK
ncbi:unnamed protein product [Amoebophrya sp. A25]|nr:unnamed protein product [Amoebophrya sp. A25]|eukprot:GSA25T00010699001.1